MFDLNEPADEPLGGSKKPPAAAAATEEEPFAGLSLLAHSAQQQQQQQEEEEEPGDPEKPENPHPQSSPKENVSSAAMEWSLGGGSGPASGGSSSSSNGGAPEKILTQGSAGGRSGRSLEMILEEDESRPEPAETMKVDDFREGDEAGPANNLCEFLTVDNKPDEVSDAPEIDLIDAFGHDNQAAPRPPLPPPGEKLGVGEIIKSPQVESSSSSGELFDDPKFGSLIWRGGLKFQEITLPNMIAACTPRWLHLFNNRKLPGELRVQRFTSSDKFVSAIKECMAEPAVRLMQRSGTSPQNLNKLVQVLVGGIDPELSLDAGVAAKGPLVALIPLQDEFSVWFADLLLLPASSLSDVEPGELSAPEEDELYGFISATPVSPEEAAFTWLKPGNGTGAADEANLVKPAANAPTGQKPFKKQQPELEEGQLVSEAPPVFEKRKRYPEEEKKAKANGEAEGGKGARERERDRERHRQREHEREREREPERGRRERDREVEHRERDVYTRRGGNHEYLPRLETKAIRHRDGEKERREVNPAWENGGGSRGTSTKERGREVERSKSREKERPGVVGVEKVLKETRSSKGIKMPETGKSKVVEAADRKRRERSPMESHRGASNGKRVKENPVAADPKVAQLAEKLAAFTDERSGGFRGGGGNNHHHVQRPVKLLHGRNESEEPELASAGDNKGDVVVDELDNEVYIEMFVESCDDETRSWLASKQNAILLREDFGVTLLRKETSSSDLTKAEREPLHLKLLVPISESCDVAEGKYFVTRAATVLRDVSRHGVFSKSLWYPGPVQPHSSSAPQLHLVVRRLKGDDGKNLDRIQDSTGVMIGLVLDADNNKKNSANSRSAIVGVRLKTSRKKGLTEATKRIRELLQEVSQAFAKEMSIPAEVNLIDDGNPKPPRLLYVTHIPEYASPRMLRAIFESGLKEKKAAAARKEPDPGAPPGFEQQLASGEAMTTTTTVVEVRYSPEEGCAFVELAGEELVDAAVQQYEKNQSSFCGLKVGLASPAEMKLYEQLEAQAPLVPPPPPPPAEMRPVKAIVESDEFEGKPQQQQGKGIKPLFLTELGNETAESIKHMFEDVITTHINPSLDAKALVLAVRHIPTRGCMFVDLATPDLVDFMLDLHFREPEVFGRVKMELGRSQGGGGSGGAGGGYDGMDHRKRGAFERSRSERNLSPRPKRRPGVVAAAAAAEVTEEEEDVGFGRPRKQPLQQRSDPEKTVYADRLPENSSDSVIRRIFRSVLLEHMSPKQRSQLGDDVVTEVRHVKLKYCAFVVFATEDLARLALELYSRDEEIFENMRLKPHFNSRLEDIYKGEDGDDTHSVEQQQKSDSYDFHQEREPSGRRGGGGERPPRVDRKRSVYVDRIPDNYHEAEVKEVLERFLRRKGRGSPAGHAAVNHVSFFRDRYDPVRVCAFAEVKNESLVQDLIDFYAMDEEAFDGMRIRPALKFNS